MSEIVKLSAAVLSTLILDGATYQPGAVVELDEDTFGSLVALKVIEVSAEKPAPVKAPPTAPEDLSELVKDAIGKLEASDFEADGIPKLTAVQALLPGQTKGITKKLVAEVWAGLKAENGNA